MGASKLHLLARCFGGKSEAELEKKHMGKAAAQTRFCIFAFRDARVHEMQVSLYGKAVGIA